MSETLTDIKPSHFFGVHADCRHVSPGKPLQLTTHRLPDLTPLHGEKKFATAYMGWNDQGLHFRFSVNGYFRRSYHPNHQDGDAIQIYIDTHASKAHTRFTHHFFFLPTEVNGITHGECTTFRGDDAHELADPSLIFFSKTVAGKRASYEIHIPAAALHGYDPDEHSRISFTYSLTRAWFLSQDFALPSSDLSPDQNPSLWSTLSLTG